MPRSQTTILPVTIAGSRDPIASTVRHRRRRHRPSQPVLHRRVDRRPEVTVAVAQGHGARVVPIVRARRDRGHPRCGMRDSARSRTLRCRPTPRRRHRRRPRTGTRSLRGVHGVVGAADRVVDHVDTVGDGLVDGRHEVDGEAAARPVLHSPERLVRGDAGTWRDAADAAETDAAPVSRPRRALPPAVLAVCVPCPSKSRAELNSQGKRRRCRHCRRSRR